MATGDVALGNAGPQAAPPAQGTKDATSPQKPIQDNGQRLVVDDSRKPVVNDFSIQVATVNGSGSQSANSVLLRSIFGMGIPVSGKNLFPSNIAGLPTWYTIRVSRDGYVARRREIELLVAMISETRGEEFSRRPPTP